MYGRAGLDRFKKAQSSEPFSLNPPTSTSASASKSNSNSKSNSHSHQAQAQHQRPPAPQEAPLVVAGAGQTPPQQQHLTQLGGGQSTWQPPDWAIEPRTGVYYLEVLKDGQVLDRITLDRRRNIFGRQSHTCDFVLDHQSVSRQHAVVVPHKNGSVYVIDLGSAHGTFVANERVTKDTPVELEVGQSLRFAASTRTYVLRKNDAALFSRPPMPSEGSLPPPPDPSDEEAVVAYNTFLNRHGLTRSDIVPRSRESSESTGTNGDDTQKPERASKRMRKLRVSFRDQVGGELVEVVGVSDGVDVETEPGPVGVKEGSLVGKYESLVQITVIPKGKEQSSAKKDNSSQKGMTEKLQEVLNRVKTTPKGGIYDDLYGESFNGKVGSSWAYPSEISSGRRASPSRDSDEKALSVNHGTKSSHIDDVDDEDEGEDDLFGD